MNMLDTHLVFHKTPKQVRYRTSSHQSKYVMPFANEFTDEEKGSLLLRYTLVSFRQLKMLQRMIIFSMIIVTVVFTHHSFAGNYGHEFGWHISHWDVSNNEFDFKVYSQQNTDFGGISEPGFGYGHLAWQGDITCRGPITGSDEGLFFHACPLDDRSEYSGVWAAVSKSSDTSVIYMHHEFHTDGHKGKKVQLAGSIDWAEGDGTEFMIGKDAVTWSEGLGPKD